MNKKLKTLYQGNLISMYTERHKYPNGSIINLEIIRHPGAVLVIPFLDKNKIVLIKQYRPVINSYIWELPAGTLRKGEDLILCAKRELCEEIGYNAKQIKKIGFIYPAPGYTTEKIVIFRADKLVKAALHQHEEDEVITPKIFSKTQIKNLIENKKIVDAKTISALALSGVI
ncbi:MAG: NUDIX hydrolase [Candidatus Omnitrophota bacterium]